MSERRMIGQVTVPIGSMQRLLESVAARTLNVGIILLFILILVSWTWDVGENASGQVRALVTSAPVVLVLIIAAVFLVISVFQVKAWHRARLALCTLADARERVTWVGPWLDPAESIKPLRKEAFEPIAVDYSLIGNTFTRVQLALMLTFAVSLGFLIGSRLGLSHFGIAALLMIVAMLGSAVLKLVLPATLRLAPGVLTLTVVNRLTCRTVLLRQAPLSEASVTIYSIAPTLMTFEWQQNEQLGSLVIRNMSVEFCYYVLWATLVECPSE